MQFRHWLQLNERGGGTLPRPIGRIAMIDMRFEDWDDNNKLKPALQQTNRSPRWYAVTPDKMHYIYFDGEKLTSVPQDLKTGDQLTSVPNAQKPEVPEVPKDVLDLNRIESKWWDYVAGYNREGYIVKVPMRVREDDRMAIRYALSKKIDVEWPGEAASKVA